MGSVGMGTACTCGFHSFRTLGAGACCAQDTSFGRRLVPTLFLFPDGRVWESRSILGKVFHGPIR